MLTKYYAGMKPTPALALKLVHLHTSEYHSSNGHVITVDVVD